MSVFIHGTSTNAWYSNHPEHQKEPLMKMVKLPPSWHVLNPQLCCSSNRPILVFFLIIHYEYLWQTKRVKSSTFSAHQNGRPQLSFANGAIQTKRKLSRLCSSHTFSSEFKLCSASVGFFLLSWSMRSSVFKHPSSSTWYNFCMSRNVTPQHPIAGGGGVVVAPVGGGEGVRTPQVDGSFFFFKKSYLT